MVSFSQAVKLFFVRWLDFSGRSSRSEFWWIMFPGLMLDSIATTAINYGEDWGLFLGLFWGIICLIPRLALFSRRMHDCGEVFFLAFVPIANIIIALGKGQPRKNKWGEPANVVLAQKFGIKSKKTAPKQTKPHSSTGSQESRKVEMQEFAPSDHTKYLPSENELVNKQESNQTTITSSTSVGEKHIINKDALTKEDNVKRQCLEDSEIREIGIKTYILYFLIVITLYLFCDYWDIASIVVSLLLFPYISYLLWPWVYRKTKRNVKRSMLIFAVMAFLINCLIFLP